MKILIIGIGYSRNGGVQNYSNNLINFGSKGENVFSYISQYNPDNTNNFYSEMTSNGIAAFKLSNTSRLKRIFQLIVHLINKGKYYDIIHINLISREPLMYGLLSQIITRAKVIYHSHIYFGKVSPDQKVSQLLFRVTGDGFLSCTEAAGEYMFGRSIKNKKNFMVAANTVDTKVFYYDEIKRNKIRTEFGLNESLLFGYVGRLAPEKRIDIIINSFSKILETEPTSKLMIIGDGPCEKDLKEMAMQLGISKNVLFLGIQSNIEYFMNAFDLLMLSSKFESFGIVLIEAQACGLPCLVGQNIPNDSCATELWHKVENDYDYNEWARKAIKYAKESHRYDTRDILEKRGFSIEQAAGNVISFYKRLMEKND